MSEEIFDVVNDRNEVIGQETRSVVHARGLKHRAVHVLVFRKNGDLFIQKRSMAKDADPGRWDTSAAGHLDAGEGYMEAARREVKEELGVDCPDSLTFLFASDARPDTGNEFIEVYRCEHEGPFVLHPDEIEDGRWIAISELEAWMKEKPGEHASALHHVMSEWRTL